MRSLGEVMDRQLFRTIFLPFYTKYLNDLEAEIRSIACTQLISLCEFLEPDDIVTKILPALRSLPQDSQVYVRRNSLVDRRCFREESSVIVLDGR